MSIRVIFWTDGNHFIHQINMLIEKISKKHFRQRIIFVAVTLISGLFRIGSYPDHVQKQSNPNCSVSKAKYPLQFWCFFWNIMLKDPHYFDDLLCIHCAYIWQNISKLQTCHMTRKPCWDQGNCQLPWSQLQHWLGSALEATLYAPIQILLNTQQGQTL